MTNRLKKYRLGELIEVCDERNSYGIKRFYGLNINKEFMPTVANTEGLDETKYKVVRNHRFVFSGMQTGRDNCIRISMYKGEHPIIVSPAYTTFEISRCDIVVPEYFFMLFLSAEKDRYGAFCSDGSIRSNLDWGCFCEFELTLPPIEVQRKFVDVYLTLQRNLEAYQAKADELKLVCDGFIEELRRNMKSEKIGRYITPIDERNSNLEIKLAQGITNEKEFSTPKQIAETETSAKIVRKNQFAYNRATTRNGERISIAYRSGGDCVVSSAYQVFEISAKDRLIPEYLMMWFKRAEFDRYARYMSKGSAHEFFEYEDMEDVQIPIPSLEIQKAIASIYNVYKERKRIAEVLKEQLKNICPVLIRGSLE